MNNKYNRRTESVEAEKYDGTPARAYEILGWVYRHNGTGLVDTVDPANPVLRVDPDGVEVKGNQWVVWDPTTPRKFLIVGDQDFHSTYDPVAP